MLTAALTMLVLALAACNLSRRSSLQQAPPTATFVAPLTLPTQDPLGATALPAFEGVSNPNCPSTPPTWVMYTVEPGDSLGLLAQQTSSSISEIVAGNCLENPDQIEVGQVLYLPAQPVVVP